MNTEHCLLESLSLEVLTSITADFAERNNGSARFPTGCYLFTGSNSGRDWSLQAVASITRSVSESSCCSRRICLCWCLRRRFLLPLHSCHDIVVVSVRMLSKWRRRHITFYCASSSKCRLVTSGLGRTIVKLSAINVSKITRIRTRKRRIRTTSYVMKYPPQSHFHHAMGLNNIIAVHVHCQPKWPVKIPNTPLNIRQYTYTEA